MQSGGPAFSAGSGRAGASPSGGAAPPRKPAPKVGGKTLKVKNNFNLHKDSMKLEPVEEGAKQELTFTFDAEIAGEAQIFWDCVDMTVPEVLADPKQLQKLGLDLQCEKASKKPKWFKFPVRKEEEDLPHACLLHIFNPSQCPVVQRSFAAHKIAVWQNEKLTRGDLILTTRLERRRHGVGLRSVRQRQALSRCGRNARGATLTRAEW